MSSPYIVQPGDYLSLIARKFGFADWREIYDHADNKAFRDRRPNANVLLPGDVLMIPDKRVKNETCGTGRLHRFQVKLAPPMQLTVIVKNEDGHPLASEAYTLKLGREVIQGVTGSDGLVSAPLPADVTTASLMLDERPFISWQLRVGHLDPARDPASGKAIGSGIQARLTNLGFSCGRIDGVIGPMTQHALARFQKVVMGRAEPAGEADAETCDRLISAHGS